MIILTIGHILSKDTIQDIKTKFNQTEAIVINVPFGLEMKDDLAAQVRNKIIRAVAGKTKAIASERLVVTLPGVSVASALVIAFLHGVLGHFPHIVELSRISGDRTIWRLKQIHDLDSFRSEGRSYRFN